MLTIRVYRGAYASPREPAHNNVIASTPMNAEYDPTFRATSWRTTSSLISRWPRYASMSGRLRRARSTQRRFPAEGDGHDRREGTGDQHDRGGVLDSESNPTVVLRSVRLEYRAPAAGNGSEADGEESGG